MPRRTLIDFFNDLEKTKGEFLTYDDGYRSWSYTYREVVAAARAVAARLRAADIGSGQHVALWSENRPEWVWTLWGCLLEGVVLVPIDYRTSADFLQHVAKIVSAKAIIVGDTVGALESEIPVWSVRDIGSGKSETPQTYPDVTPDTVAEVIFTSGATSEPKGVVLTHRNILANIIPIEHEVAKYRRYARPFLPIRFLNLLPLSHMFGQAMATFMPPMLPGTVVFTRSFAPEDIVSQIRTRRISILVCVPKMLEVLREHIRRVVPESDDPPPPGMHWALRWWRYRRVHSLFGYKFWAIVVGAAALDPELEAFFGRLGFLVVQGYGLTETAPIVTLNHPFRAARGAVGKPLAGVEIRIADDGEILVRGENVTRGYFNAPDATRDAFEDGWFHTGDIGGLDESGQLYIRGRKKEMIVTPEGLNVFPEDVERVLNEIPGVRDSAVVGAPFGESNAERVQAVLLLDDPSKADDVVRQANVRLLDHQKIRAAVVWPEAELPRTEGTRKLKRRELRQWLMAGRLGSKHESKTIGTGGRRDVVGILSRFAPGRNLTSSTTIDELGLSSLERVELMMALEEGLQVTVDEAKFAAARTIGDLEELAEKGTVPFSEGVPAEKGTVPLPEPIEFPSWNRTIAARALRRASLPTWILPLGRLFMSLEDPGPREPRPDQRPGHLRRQSSESFRYAGHPDGAAAAMAVSSGAGHGQGVLQSSLLPRPVQMECTHPEQRELLSSVALFQRFPSSATRSGHSADAPVYWSAARRGFFGFDLSRRQANGCRRDQAFPGGGRDDRVEARRPGRAREAGWARPYPPSQLEIPDNGGGRASRLAGLCR